MEQETMEQSEIAIQAYLKKQEKNQINKLTLHLKQLDKEEMNNPRVSRRKEIIKIRAEIHEKETKETKNEGQDKKAEIGTSFSKCVFNERK